VCQGEFLDPGMNIYSFSFYLLGTVYVPVYHRSRAAINSAAACARRALAALLLLPLPGCGNATYRTAADRVPGRGFFSYDGGVC
jgi:hypothetical protein